MRIANFALILMVLTLYGCGCKVTRVEASFVDDKLNIVMIPVNNDVIYVTYVRISKKVGVRLGYPVCECDNPVWTIEKDYYKEWIPYEKFHIIYGQVPSGFVQYSSPWRLERGVSYCLEYRVPDHISGRISVFTVFEDDNVIVDNTTDAHYCDKPMPWE